MLARLDASRRQDVHRVVCDRRKLGDLERSATVVPVAAEHASSSIGDVALFTDAPQQTCDITKQTCEDGLLEQRISDVGDQLTLLRTGDRAAAAGRRGP